MNQKEFIESAAQRIQPKAEELSKQIWEFAELSYEETRSAKAICDCFLTEGFEIKMNIADIPTAFCATYTNGNGGYKVGILGEFDALDGLSQEASIAEKRPLICGGTGHGCGHNLLGAGAFAAAVILKDYIKENNINATIVYFGCPAEEGAGSKQFIARAGYFDDIDFVYTWHPSTMNEVQSNGSVAIMGANFIFDGISAHAGGSPHLGRSALDAAELMNVGVNYLREHMIDSARVHYAYSDAGGTAPNVVQDHVVIKYEVRAPKVENMQELFARVVNISKGAALMTETKTNYEITMAFSDYTPNKVLAQIADEALCEIGSPNWSDDDYDLAWKFLHTYNKSTIKDIKESLLDYYDADMIDSILQKPLDSEIHPFNISCKTYESGSTDVGDVGYATPTVNINVATACIGNVGHSWQNTAFSNSDIGRKGMMTAAKAIALSAVKTLERPEAIDKAKAELRIKNNGKYLCPLPDYVQPPIGKY